jgi:hypothetical protein
MRLAYEIGGIRRELTSPRALHRDDGETVWAVPGEVSTADFTNLSMAPLRDPAGSLVPAGVEVDLAAATLASGSWVVDLPLPPPDPLRVAYRAAGIDPDNPPTAEVDEENATPFAELEVGKFYPPGFRVDVGGTVYAVSRGGFHYGAWSAASLIALNHLVPAEPAEPGPGGVPAWQAGVSYTLPAQVTHGGVTYNLVQAHTSLAGWEPPNVPALWSPAP